jgi:hypothetical protein
MIAVQVWVPTVDSRTPIAVPLEPLGTVVHKDKGGVRGCIWYL